MTETEVIQALADGKILDDLSGRQYYFDGVAIKVKEHNYWIPQTVSAAYILAKPHSFKVVE